SRLRMSDVGLHGSEQKRLIRLPIAAVDSSDSADLDRVTQRRARAMRLEIADFTGLDLGIVKRSLDDVSLRKRVRRGQAVTRAVLIDCRAAYHCKYPVPISLRLGQRLQDDDGRPLAAYIPVRARVERLATSVGSKHVRFTEGL